MTAEITLASVSAKLDAVLATLATMGAQPREVLNVEEAAAFVGKPSVEAFAAWRKRYGVRPVAHGRYSVTSLRRAMEREARKTYQHGLG